MTWPAAPCGQLTMALDGTILRLSDGFAQWLGVPGEEVLGVRSFASFLTPGSRVTYLSRHVPDLARNESLTGVLLELRAVDRRTIPILMSATIDHGTSPPLIAAAAIEASDRAAYEYDLLQAKQRAEAAASRLGVLHAVAAACARTAVATDIAHAVVDVVRDGFAAYGCAVWLNEDGALRRVAAHIPNDALAPEAVADDSDEPVAVAWRTNALATIRREDPNRPEALAAAMSACGVDEKIAVPLVFERNVLGVMALYLRRNEPTSETEYAVLTTLGAQVGQTLERARLHAELERRALHDALTELPNRALLLDRLARGLARAERAGGALAVLLLDLNGFKAVNDRFGHAVGDRLLVQVADRLRSVARKTDTVARLGGDEFVVVFEKVDEASAGLLTRRVQEAIEIDVTIEGRTQHVSASVGTVVHGAADGAVDGATLLSRADNAMYRAKRARASTAIRS